jgi:hypothetical protein
MILAMTLLTLGISDKQLITKNQLLMSTKALFHFRKP